MNCSDPISLTLLALATAAGHTYSPAYDCTQFSFALGNALQANNCTFRMVTGWYGTKGQQRYWHRWIETPEYSIEATPKDIKTFTNNKLYSKSYSTKWNWSHEYG